MHLIAANCLDSANTKVFHIAILVIIMAILFKIYELTQLSIRLPKQELYIHTIQKTVFYEYDAQIICRYRYTQRRLTDAWLNASKAFQNGFHELLFRYITIQVQICTLYTVHINIIAIFPGMFLLCCISAHQTIFLYD